jgi:pullulanase/glycogen debranching enzyme
VLRGEAFNVFNHTQFTGINSTLNFSGLTNPTYTNLPYNSIGKLTNITGFGTVSGVASPRTMQLVMKVQF